jgi:single-stranded DNA-binding protein
MLSEGYGFAYGNLCRDWEAKTVTAQGSEKTIWVNALAYQPKKDDQTIYIDLTVWPDNNGSDRDGQAFADNTSKGSRVMIRGKLAPDNYVSKEGQPKIGWKCSVWDLASMVRAPFEGGGNNVAAAFPGATEVPKGHEPF